MTATWVLQALFYLAMASAVIAVNRHRRYTRVAGAMLLLFSLISSATFFMGLPFHLRVMRELLLIAPVATVFAYLFSIHDGNRCYRWALMICLFDVAFCGATFLHGSTGLTMRSLFGWVVNMNFTGLCACVAAPGVRDAYRGWIDSIDRDRRVASSTPDMDWAIRAIDRADP